MLIVFQLVAVVVVTCQTVIDPVFGSPTVNESTLGDKTKREDTPKMSMPNYLMSFGYIDKDAMDGGNLRSGEHLKSALKSLQKIGHIPETGRLDVATQTLMGQPRCGMPDVVPHERARRYTLGDTKWDHSQITWSLGRVPRHLRRDEVRHAVHRAFAVWSRETSLTFRELAGDPAADIQIAFGAGGHGDMHDFDGPGQVLAHAFAPARLAIGGDTHFDEDEQWTLETSDGAEGTHFFMVAVHEFGHSLGLKHSDVQKAVMYPWYSGSDTEKLEDDDVTAIQILYGRNGDAKGNGQNAGSDPPRDRPGYPPNYPSNPPRERPSHSPNDPSNPPRERPSHSPNDPSNPPRERPSYSPNYPSNPPRERPSYSPNDPSNPPRERPSHSPNDPSNPPRERPSYSPNYPSNPPRERPSYSPNYPSNPPREPPRERPSNPGYPPNDAPRYPPQTPSGENPNNRQYPEHRYPNPRPTAPNMPAGRRPTGPSQAADNPPEYCNVTFDAVSMLRGELFMFKGPNHWRIRVTDFAKPRNPPQSTKNLWRQLPDDSIDGVYERPDGDIVFFVGNSYYVFSGVTLKNGPLPLRTLGLPRSLAKIDAVTRWKGSTYLFAGKEYWRFDETSQRVDADYPKRTVDGWRGLEGDFDAAFQWVDQKTYFFMGREFAQFDDDLRMKALNSTHKATTYWMNCKAESAKYNNSVHRVQTTSNIIVAIVVAVHIYFGRVMNVL